MSRFVSALPRAGLIVLCAFAFASISGAAQSDAPTLEQAFMAFEDGNVPDEEQAAALKALERRTRTEKPQWLRRFAQVRCWNENFTDPAQGLAFAKQQRLEAEQAGDKPAAVQFLLCYGLFEHKSGWVMRALNSYNRALEQARALGQPRLLAKALDLRADLYAYRGDYALALRDALESNRIYAPLEHVFWKQYNMSLIASLYWRMGEQDKTLEYHKPLQQYYEQRGEGETAWRLRNDLGNFMKLKGDLSGALAEFEANLAAARRAKDSYLIISTLLSLAEVEVEPAIARYQQALLHVHEARQGIDEANDAPGWSRQLVIEGRALSGLRRYQEALTRFAEAARRVEPESAAGFLATLYQAKATTLAAMGDHAGAYAALLKQQEAARRASDAENKELSARLRFEFDSERREAEKSQLKQDKAAVLEKLNTVELARKQERISLLLAGLLFVVLAMLGVRMLLGARRMKILALTDELTGLPNRRHILQVGSECYSKARRDGSTLSVLVVDIDHFKRINDQLGHDAGDKVLARAARACQGALRQFDAIGRVGGEEFLVILPAAALAQAAQVAERVRVAVMALQFGDISPTLKVTLSLGVAELAAGDATLQSLIQRADEALYRAKQGGRNCAVLAAAPRAA